MSSGSTRTYSETSKTRLDMRTRAPAKKSSCDPIEASTTRHACSKTSDTRTKPATSARPARERTARANGRCHFEAARQHARHSPNIRRLSPGMGKLPTPPDVISKRARVTPASISATARQTATSRRASSRATPSMAPAMSFSMSRPLPLFGKRGAQSANSYPHTIHPLRPKRRIPWRSKVFCVRLARLTPTSSCRKLHLAEVR